MIINPQLGKVICEKGETSICTGSKGDDKMIWMEAGTTDFWGHVILTPQQAIKLTSLLSKAINEIGGGE